MSIIILAIIIFAIGLPISISINKKKARNLGNEKFQKYIEDNNIFVSKFVDMPTISGTSKFLVDEKSENVYYLATNNNTENIFVNKIPFKDVIKCELIKDSKTKLIEEKFSLFDNYNSKEYVKKFGIRIIFNDMNFPCLEILFLNSAQGQTLFGLDHVVKATNEWISIMNIVIERGKRAK
ncbi:hypothetical protein FORC3_1989 [Clostridium perfringens]|uniref:hypothetical protein n=1 Tax=Clostridium perfringens TaxID=1502 RepID=UPI0007068FF6|nr:hypothetical protein [Clostridium perfringens]ALG49366.1 hypothetical protein FORC3_1989 [Clostridium perfringens]ELC8461450.1 hypothetical protein [Clostridium perfringens]